MIDISLGPRPITCAITKLVKGGTRKTKWVKGHSQDGFLNYNQGLIEREGMQLIQR